MSRYLLTVAILGAASLSAQTSAAFEVTTVKLADQGNCSRGGGQPILSPGRITLPCAPVRMLIAIAFTGGITAAARRMEPTGGPSWLETDLYDITGGTSSAATLDQLTGPLLKSLLEDRFRLKAHIESRDSPVYLMSVAKPSHNIHPAAPGACTPADTGNAAAADRAQPGNQKICGVPQVRPGSDSMIMDWAGVTMAQFAGRLLETRLGLPVVDRTGLGGAYDIHFELVPPRRNDGALNAQSTGAPVATDPAGPDIVRQIQEQLGLKLTPGRAPVDVLVIDSISRPSEN